MKPPQPKIALRLTLVACTVSVLAVVALSDRNPSQATEAKATIVAQVGAVSFTPPPPPPDRDAPGNRGGGAGRGCGVSKQFVTALMPEYQQALAQGGAITKVWATTMAERPTLWFDIPYDKKDIAVIEFVLQDNANPANDLYQTAIAPPETPGIVSISLPTTVSPLETGKLYQWFFTVRLQCGASASAVNPQMQTEETSGWVQRLSPSATLTSQLKQATPQQQAALYAQNGVWVDALTTLAELRLLNPQEVRLTEEWKNLLQTVGLEKLATKPLLKCCHSKH